MPAEGKSTTAANLAVSFAQLGRRVLIVDADLRRPTLHHVFGLPNNGGLTDVLVRGVDWRQMLQETDLENLQVLSAGFTPPNPVELLTTQRMKALTAQIKHAFDLVIFDAPMVLSIPDVVTLAPIMDGVLLVHAPIHRDKSSIVQAKRLLERLGASLVGVILNDVSDKDAEYYTRYRYKSALQRPANAPVFIDMRPMEGGESWILDSLDSSNGIGTPPIPINKTASSEGFAVTILEMSLQPHIAEAESDPGFRFLVLDAVLVNEAESAYSFHPEQTAIVTDAQNEYSRALTSLIEVPSGSGAGGSPSRGTRVYKYDPLTTGKLERGIVGEEIIAAANVKRGLLAYRVPLDADNYSFEYEHEDINITLPLKTS
jgi:capsular exopolysaccharide synthesis family protein